MKKNVILILGILIFLIIILDGIIYAEESSIEINYARDPPVHQYLVYQGYLLLTGDVKEEVGRYIGSASECVDTFCGSEDAGKSIAEGAYEEDKFGNWMYHFWDPDTGNGLYWAKYQFPSAYERAKELWNESLELYSQSKIEEAYYTLGKVAHLLADVSVPAHVNMDAHPPWDKDNYEEYVSAHYEEYDLEFREIGELKDLYELFYRLAEEADNYDSDYGCGEGTVCWWNSWCVHGHECGIMEKDCKIIAEHMIPITIVRIAGLYKLFWRLTNHSRDYVVEIRYPEEKFYETRKVRFEVESNFKLDKMVYIENNREKLLCRGCQNYSGSKTFRDGEHEIIFKMIDFENVVYEEKIDFFVDSKKPRIYSSEPRRGFANGSFRVIFREDNPIELILNYGGRESLVDLEDCNEKTGKKYCEVKVDLNEFDGEEIVYWFELKDIVGSVVMSKKQKVGVDLSEPVIWSLEYSIKGRGVEFEIKIDEKNFDKIIYFENGRGKVLCSRLIGGVCKSRETFGYGHHNLRIKVLDEAGNYVEEEIEFEIRKN